MNFIQLAQETRKRAGLQGTGPSSVDTTGYEAAIIAHVKDAWRDIQNERKDWKWMRGTAIFLTGSLVDTYTIEDILGSSPRHKYWLKDTCFIEVDGSWSRLWFQEYESFVESNINTEEGGVPSRFTIDPSDYSIIVNLPDDNYNIRIDYQKSPQELTTEVDEPELPDYYHILIVYAATANYSEYLGKQETFSYYNLKYARLLNILMRDKLPKKVLKVRGIA